MTDERATDVAGPPAYREPARSYASAGWFALALLAGFGVDLGFGGGIAHLPGWIIAFVLVVGVNVLLVYSARATRSLRLDTQELRVGDEVLPRADIVGVDAGVDADLPTLGWETGMPKGVGGVTVTLADGQQVVVPSRHPDRLLAALGVGAPAPGADHPVRRARQDEYPLLAEIDERAEVVFRVAGYDLPRLDVDPAGFADAATVLVIDEPPVGFARLDIVDGTAHLAELAVLPGSMGRGLGSRLLEHACSWAREAGYPAITLTTYADLAWNAPFYAARDFRTVDDFGPGLAAIRAREAALGLDAVGPRVVMRRALR